MTARLIGLSCSDQKEATFHLEAFPVSYLFLRIKEHKKYSRRFLLVFAFLRISLFAVLLSPALDGFE